MPRGSPSSVGLAADPAQPRPTKRWLLAVALGCVAVLATGAFVVWSGLNYQPEFYAQDTAIPAHMRQDRAEKFLSQSLQLRNDIANEARWEAAFTDEEVNAWLAKDLVESFADQLPAGVSEPRVRFETDRVTVAFRYRDGLLNSIFWAVIQISVPRDNELRLTIEKIQAGAFPIPIDEFLERMTQHARSRGLEIQWGEEDGLRVATVHYTTAANRRDVVLERVHLSPGLLRLSGRSDKNVKVAVAPRLPGRESIQSRFSKRQSQIEDDGSAPAAEADDTDSTTSSKRPRNERP